MRQSATVSRTVAILVFQQTLAKTLKNEHLYGLF